MSMRGEDGFLQARWHWLALGLGVVTFAGALVYAFGEWGVDPDEAAQEAVSRYDDRRGPATAGVQPADLADYQRAARDVKSPTPLMSVPEQEGSFLASEKRVHCKFCAGALEPTVKTCPFCSKDQPEEQKTASDTDGDGLPDEWEKKFGLNPNDPADAQADPDGDLFTNAEEYEAKTDPKDRRDHPDYLDSLTLQLPLNETVLPFYFRQATKVPAGIRFQFFDPKKRNDYGKPGTVYSVLAGEKIGATGYTVRKYTEKHAKRKIAGSVNEKTVDVSVATIERTSDGKVIDLVVDERRIAVDVQAKLLFSRGATRSEFTVVPGDTIDLNGEKHKIRDLKALPKGAEIVLENTLTGKIRKLSALEQ